MRQNATLCGNGLNYTILQYVGLFNPLLNDKILDLRKLKAFADNKLNLLK